MKNLLIITLSYLALIVILGIAFRKSVNDFYEPPMPRKHEDSNRPD